MARPSGNWRRLEPEQRLACGAAAALFVTMLLPWYQQNAVVNAARAPLQSRNLNAFQVFSFVEAAVLLVAVAVIYMLYARAEGHAFHLPGSDGTVVLAAGLWTALLLVFRLFDKPGLSSHGIAGNVGVQWGIFFALAAAGLLAYTGSRMRAASQPEPPRSRSGAGRRDPAPEEPPTPDWPPREEEVPALASPTGPRPARSRPVPARERPRYPPAPSDQMSFDDSPPGSDRVG